MKARFRFSWEKDWRHAPLAYWVHVQDPTNPQAYDPPAPAFVPHKGFVFLRVEYGSHELIFSSPEQLAHFIEVMGTRPLPTARRLAAQRGTGAGPNGHWLSRLPAELKPPAARVQLLRHLRAVYGAAVTGTPTRTGKPGVQPLWPGLKSGSPGRVG